MVPRTGGYAYDVGVRDLSIVQGPFSVAPCQTLKLRFATVSSLYASAVPRTTQAATTQSGGKRNVRKADGNRASARGVSGSVLAALNTSGQAIHSVRRVLPSRRTRFPVGQGGWEAVVLPGSTFHTISPVQAYRVLV
jgi:hypothetical protein